MPRATPAAAPRRRRRHTAADSVAPISTAPARPALELLEPAGVDEQLSALLAEFPAGLVVRLERKRTPNGAPGGYLGTLDATPDLEEVVKERFGGGEYTGRVADSSGYRGRIAFTIAGAPRDPDAAPAPRAAESAGLERLETLLAGMLEAQRDSTRALLEAMQRRGDNGGGSQLETAIALAKAVRELAPAPVAPVAAAAPVDPFASVEQLLRIQALLSDAAPKGGGTDWAPLIRDGVRPLIGVIHDKLQLDREVLNRRHPVAVAALNAPAAVQLETSDPLVQLVAHVPGFARDFLAGQARAGKSASLYADMVLDNLPGDVVDKLPELLEPDDAAARLCAAVPQWAPFGVWFGELVNELRASLVDDDETTSSASSSSATGAP